MNRRDFLAGALATGVAGGEPAGATDASGAGFEPAARYSAARRGVSLVVMAHGQVVFEDYPNEGSAQVAWELASGTKSFCGVWTAAAAADRLLSLDEPCARTLPEWSSDLRSAITLRQLLTLTSGLAAGPIGRPPTYSQAVNAQAVAEAGSRFQYGPTPFQVFGEIMRRKLAARGHGYDPLRHLHARVLEPAGVNPSFWRRGADGMPLLSHGAALTARAWARYGQFVLDGAPGLDAGALGACFEGTAANPGYGLAWWLLRPGLVPPGPNAGVSDAQGDALRNEDVAMAAGAGNQRLYLLRRRGLVVVRQASGTLDALRGRGAQWSDREFLETLLQ